RVEGGRSPLGRFGKCEACRSATYVTKNTKKSGNRSASMKFRLPHIYRTGFFKFSVVRIHIAGAPFRRLRHGQRFLGAAARVHHFVPRGIS
ncbi:MAG: hypothetical protein WBW41_06165, partial [Verrucomicrobiia bacterium]